MDFAALETQVNDAVIQHLNNRTVTIAGNSITGVFDDRYVEAAFVESSNPFFTVKESDLVGGLDALADRSEVVDGSTLYEVASSQPDGTGLVKIELRLK